MRSGGKGSIFIFFGIVALLLNAFVFNVTIAMLLIAIVAFILVKPFVLALVSPAPVDTFVTETVKRIDAVPEIIEHVEEKVHEEVEIVKVKVSKVWSLHHNEVENIAGELENLKV
ncbi:MAG: hypothetical protein QF475_01690 [Candidatus Undinarchaeales archaeon]|jgi:hypothetical protein|nr:hypothetical protein [Candidatus Undinarchaeales archaeon]